MMEEYSQTTNLIQSVGVGSTVIYVSNLRPFFNAKNENLVNTDFQKDIVIFNNAERVAAAATAVYLLQEQLHQL